MTCCGKSDIDSNDIKTGNFYQEQYMQSPKFAALKNFEKIALVIKLQSVFRGYLARKRVQMIKESLGYRTNQGMMVANYPVGADGNIVLNYENPDVIVSYLYQSPYFIL